jgi:hypothetical protein
MIIEKIGCLIGLFLVFFGIWNLFESARNYFWYTDKRKVRRLGIDEEMEVRLLMPVMGGVITIFIGIIFGAFFLSVLINP